jgi:hypothetical protein
MSDGDRFNNTKRPPLRPGGAPQAKPHTTAHAASRPQPVPGVLQRKPAQGQPGRGGVKPIPAAPPVYRPQPAPKVLQTKKPPAPRPLNQTRTAPAAPPVYRPQPAPKVLQTKTAGGQHPSAGQSRPAPAAPPVYRPQPAPRCLQPKARAPQQSQTAQAKSAPAAPPVYRPQAAPRCLQRKAAGETGRPALGPAAPKLHRPTQSAAPAPRPTPTRPAPRAARPVVQRYVTWLDQEDSGGVPTITRARATTDELEMYLEYPHDHMQGVIDKVTREAAERGITRRELVDELVKSEKEKAVLPVGDYDAVINTLVGALSKRLEKKMFADYRKEMATEQEQLFGIEIELKGTRIPYNGGFAKWAKKHGHKPLYRHRKLPFEIHLDQGVDGKSALLEIVSFPPKPMKELEASLLTLKKDLGKSPNAKALLSYLNEAFAPAFTDKDDQYAYDYINENLKLGSGQFFPSMVQVTTTHTASELVRLPVFPTMTSGLVRHPVKKVSEAVSLKKEAIEQHGEQAIQDYLSRLASYSKTTSGKGTKALIKHAHEQFTDAPLGISPATKMKKLRQGGNTPLDQLKTLGNKLAPVFKRPGTGETAYVIEYRGGSPSNVEAKIGDWLNDKGGESLTELLSTLTPK